MNFSGCGNSVNCNNPVTSQLILDSLRYWVVNMHIDGFRFDLASILTRAPNGAVLGQEMPSLTAAISADPILGKTKIIAGLRWTLPAGRLPWWGTKPLE